MSVEQVTKPGKVREEVVTFGAIAELAGFTPGPDGKLNIPATQESADKLSAVCHDISGRWQPGDDRLSLTITGAGPVWGYLAVAHALHGRCARLIYAAPNATIVVFNHGCE